MGYDFLCEVTNEPMHSPRGECAWFDEHGFWAVLVDRETGVAFTVKNSRSAYRAYGDPMSAARAAWKATP